MASTEPPGSSNPSLYSVTPPQASPAGGLAYQHATRAVVAALVFNLCIAALKFWAYRQTGSSAMWSETLHSLGDGINSFALLTGVRMSHREPDRTHPFGYGLEASVWAIPACAFLFLFSAMAVWEGVQHLQHPAESLESYYWALGVLMASLVLEFFAVRYAAKAVLEEVGVEASGFQVIPMAFRHIRQVTAPTTRFVFYEDSLAFLGAFIALVAITLSYFAVSWNLLSPQWAHWPDAIASIFIGLILAGMSIYLFRHNRGILTGTAANPKTESKIRELVLSLHGVSEVHDLITIDRGPAGLTVHMKVEVEPDTQVKDVDDLTERIKERLQERVHNVRQVFIEVLADESELAWSEQFYQLIAQGRQEGVLKPREETILRNVYDFTEAVVRDIMVPRTDVEYVDVESSLSEVADLVIETGHSRLPVFQEHVDHIIGMVHARDVFDRIRKNQLNTPLSEVLREIDIYPENKPVSDLLEDFKRKKISIAAVADEHGGFSGLVTIEDLIEEIVGEIGHDHPMEEVAVELLEPNRLVVSGKFEIEDLNERFDLNIPQDDFKTVGGFVFGTLGREPEQGDTVNFEDLTLTVTEVEGPRITTVMIQSPVPFTPATEAHTSEETL